MDFFVESSFSISCRSSAYSVVSTPLSLRFSFLGAEASTLASDVSVASGCLGEVSSARLFDEVRVFCGAVTST